MRMKKKQPIASGRGSRRVKNVISVVLVLYTLVTIYLVGNTVISSFKTKVELVTNMMGLPEEPTLANYYTVFVEDQFLRYLFNSIVLVACSLLLLLIVSSMLAYGVAQYKFRGRGLLSGYLLIGLMVPVQLSLLPLYLMLSKVGMVNMWGLILVYAANLSFCFTVFHRFFEGLPVAVIESARMDGASDMKIFSSIVIPISKPVFATTGLLQFIMIWNDFFLPMVFLTKKSSYTLTLAIYSYTQNFLKNWDKIFAVVTLSLIPILTIYFLFSEQIMQGLTSGAIKE